MRAVILILVVMLGGCAQTPTHFILAPDQTAGPVQINADGARNLTVNDMRAQQYIIRINRGEEQSTLVSLSQSPIATVEQSLLARFAKHSVSLENVTYNVDINDLIINVAQQAIKYESASQLTLTVRVNNGATTLNKTFKRAGTSHGPLQADLAVLERDFNLLLSQMLDDITTDDELLNLVNSH